VIDDLQRQVRAQVAERRKLSPEVVRTLADGRVYTADQALAAGLVDAIGYMGDAVAVARKAAGVDEAKVIVYHRPREYRATYYARGETVSGGIDAALAQIAMGAPGPRFLYLLWP
jgi:protease-4